MVRRFALLRVESGGNIVEKLVKPGSNLRFVTSEELFNIIHEVHLEKGNSGRDIMQKVMTTRFCNVTTEHVNMKNVGRRGVVVKPILSNNVIRGQVVLIDMQVC